MPAAGDGPILDHASQVGKRIVHHRHPVLDADEARSLPSNSIVVGDIYVDEPIQRIEVRSRDSAHDRLVGLSETPFRRALIVPAFAAADQSWPRSTRVPKASQPRCRHPNRMAVQPFSTRNAHWLRRLSCLLMRPRRTRSGSGRRDGRGCLGHGRSAQWFGGRRAVPRSARRGGARRRPGRS